MTEDLLFLIGAVKEAAAMITDDFEVNAKDDDGDLVTNFDYEIEKCLIDKLRSRYPGFSIVSEEYNAEEALTDDCFTIDPIDGMVNFANRVPLWGVQVACLRDGKPCAAVIYLPKMDELYCADETGAFLNGSRIRVNGKDLKNGLWTAEGLKNIAGEYRMKTAAHQFRDFHCAAVAFAYVACGRLSAASFHWDTPWDYIPGEYIARQAGALIHNEPGLHVAANSEAFLQAMLERLLAVLES